MIAFLARGTEEDLRRARIIGDAFVFAQENDRFYDDGRLRNAYSSGDIEDHSSGKARLPGWWDDDSLVWSEDPYQVGSYTGEMAWTIIAWLTYDQVIEEARYRASALSLAEWIYRNCWDSDGIPGYLGGYIGADPEPEREGWKSTEQNADVYVAFTRLFEATRDSIWLERAQLAWNLVEAMWDSATTHFWTGTTDDRINRFSPLDPQTSALLAGYNNGAYNGAIGWTEENCGMDILDFQGFHYSTVCDGIWWEGTAQMCCVYQVNENAEVSDFFLNKLRLWQRSAPNGNEKGIVACYPDSIWTGITRETGRWYYYSRLHVGATAWYIFAERQYNPYWNEPTDRSNSIGFLSDMVEIPDRFYLSEPYPNPFNSETRVTYGLPKSAHISIKVFNVTGRMIAILINDKQPAGSYTLVLNGLNSSGIFFIQMESSGYNHVSKAVIIR